MGSARFPSLIRAVATLSLFFPLSGVWADPPGHSKGRNLSSAPQPPFQAPAKRPPTIYRGMTIVVNDDHPEERGTCPVRQSLEFNKLLDRAEMKQLVEKYKIGALEVMPVFLDRSHTVVFGTDNAALRIHTVVVYVQVIPCQIVPADQILEEMQRYIVKMTTPPNRRDAIPMAVPHASVLKGS